MNNNILIKLRGSLLNRTDISSLPERVWKRSAALNTWGTNAIEGSTISWKDAQDILLKERTVGNRPIKDVMETVQHERAFRGILKRRAYPIGLETILELHQEVFKGILADAGTWRRINVRISGASFTPPRMEKVVIRLEEWMDRYHRKDLEGEDVFTLAAGMHFGFESIHPFSDGNGRIGRLLLNLHFMKHNWPPIHILPHDRDDYLDSLNRAADNDLGPMISLFRKLMGSGILDLLDQVGTAEDELLSLKEASEYVPYDPKYLGLRCKQGELPGLLLSHRWRTSKRALDLYIEERGRK